MYNEIKKKLKQTKAKPKKKINDVEKLNFSFGKKYKNKINAFYRNENK